MTDGAGTERAQAALIRAFLDARDSGDTGLIERAALSLPTGQRFGEHPGLIPALLHEAYSAAAAPPSRCRLAAALARAWVYGGHAERAVVFADEALSLASVQDDPRLLADALDAALLARWGPDGFGERLSLAARLDDTAAHLADPELRLSAHLWRLTTAWECLDVVAVQRQLRALDALADETGSARIAFFAASRRAMHALVTADLATADELIARVGEIGSGAAEPDLEAVTHSLAAARARRAGDLATLRHEAPQFAEYGASQGMPAVSVQGAVLWLEAGQPAPALDLLHQLAGGGLDTVARDVDFLLTTVSLVHVAAALHGGDGLTADILADGVRLLEPYAGRAVLDSGAVVFHGVVDDYLFRACRALGQPAAHWRDHAASCYRRIGAAWWLRRLSEPGHLAAGTPRAVIHLRRDAAGSGWVAGFDGATFALPDLKGLNYLRHLLGRPGADVAALDLAAVAAGHGGQTVTESGGGELLDAQALAAYKQRLRDIDAELDEARSWADEGRAARLAVERDALLDEVRAAAGLGGRHRRFGSADERARIAVRKAIAAALARIGQHDAALARLLRDGVRTGAACRFEPDPTRPVTWVLEAGPAPHESA